VSPALARPVVTTNPNSQSILIGNTVTFTAAASGNPMPTVQWELSTNGGATFSDINGATNTTYSFTAAAGETGNEYKAIFTNSQGSATSNAATLTVTGVRPVVTTNPTSQSVLVGDTATFTAAASGNPTPTVQWQLSSDGGRTFTNIKRANNTTYNFTPDADQTGDEYQAVFTNSQGSATTTAATLTVTTPPTVSGIVYNDKNGDGIEERKDPVMANITVTLQKLKHRRPSGKAQTTTTNASGDYTFTNLIAGATYEISETVPRKYTITQPSTEVYTINLSADEDLTGENFGDHKGARRDIALVARPSTPFATAGNAATFAAVQTDSSALLFGRQNYQGLFAG
jgi:predicted secreted protein